MVHHAVMAVACFLELELKTDLEVATRGRVPLLRIIACGIRAKGGADVCVELVKDVVHSGKGGMKEDVRRSVFLVCHEDRSGGILLAD